MLLITARSAIQCLTFSSFRMIICASARTGLSFTPRVFHVLINVEMALCIWISAMMEIMLMVMGVRRCVRFKKGTCV